MNVWQLILIQLVTFGLIVFFLKQLLQGQISHAVKRLQKLNEQNMEKEKMLKEELARAKKEAELEIKRGKESAESIREEAKEEAERLREAAVEKSREEAKRIVDEAAKELKRKESELSLEVENRAVRIAVDMLKYIFTDKTFESLQSQLIDELIMDIKALDKGKFALDETEAEVISVHGLQDKQKEKLRAILYDKIGQDITLTEKLSPDIIAGISVRMGNFVIEGSIKNKLRKVVPLMREKAKRE